MIDSHAHLDFDDFAKDVDDVILRAKNSGVLGVVNVGIDIESSRKSLRLARRYEGVIFAACGFHPHDAAKLDDKNLEALRWLCAEFEVKAIGETGLDYYKEYSPKDVQVSAFRAQIELAQYYEKPLIVHARAAFDDALKIVREYKKRGALSGVFHCFSGDVGVANEVLELGFLLGIAGPLTFKNASKLADVVKFVPLDSILIETDAPFLAPHPYRGKRNEPAYVPLIAEKIAELKRASLEEVDRQTSLNATLLLGLDKKKPIFAYVLGNNCYLNVTNRCINECEFCYGRYSKKIGQYNLKLEREPVPEEIVVQVKNPANYDEVVFCGFGEPLLKPKVVVKTSELLRKRGAKRIRVDTNGLAEAHLGEEILPNLEGKIDAISISLNAPDAATYQKICCPKLGERAFDELINFIKRAKNLIPDVWVTVVDFPGVDVERCKKLADELGVRFRLRPYSEPPE